MENERNEMIEEMKSIDEEVQALELTKINEETLSKLKYLQKYSEQFKDSVS